VAKVYGFNEEGYNRVREATRRVLGQPRVGSQRTARQPVLGGSSGSCPEVHELTTTGTPTSGTATLSYSINGVVDTVVFDWNEGAAGAVTAMETHSEVTPGDIECFCGPLPAIALYVKFQANLAGVTIDLPTISDSITGGDLRVRKAASYDWGPA
jgi:hypothetical protein